MILFFVIEYNKTKTDHYGQASQAPSSNHVEREVPARVKVSKVAKKEIALESNQNKLPKESFANDAVDEQEAILMEKIKEREGAIAAQSQACRNGIDSLLSDGNYIDPQSDYYKNAEEVESKLFQILPMMRNDVALETSYMIEGFLQQRDSSQPQKLLDLFSEFQESCLESKAITFIQSAIESCKEDCPARLRRGLAGLIYDGLPLLLHDSAGAERILLSLTILENAHRFGIYRIDLQGVNDLRFRVQRNYELMQEEIDQARENPGRQSQSIRDFMEENHFLAREVGELLKVSAESYYP